MPSSIATPLSPTAEPLARVCVERRIFVGEDREAFIKNWLEPFDADYGQGRIEGYVLDLAGGRLWAALDLSDISDAAYRDIALLSVAPDDAEASEAFLGLVRSCDPVTSENILTCAFDSTKWPMLAATCKAFTRNYGVQEPNQSLINEDFSWVFIPDESTVPVGVLDAEEGKHVFHCVLPNGSQKNHSQGNEETHLAGGTLRVSVKDDETVGLAKQLAGSPWPDQLDRNNAILFLTCIELALIHRHQLRNVRNVQKLLVALRPLPKLTAALD